MTCNTIYCDTQQLILPDGTLTISAVNDQQINIMVNR